MRMRLSAAMFVLIIGIPFSAVSGKAQAASQLPNQPFHKVPLETRAQTMDHHDTSRAKADALRLTFGDQSAVWTAATLADMPHVTLTVYNEHTKANQTYSGVPLISLLTKIGVPDKPHGKDFRLYLLAEGADGYGVVYSVGEVTPDVHNATILVADGLAGKPLAESGPLQLVATGEKRPARWVRNLVSIRVLPAQ